MPVSQYQDGEAAQGGWAGCWANLAVEPTMEPLLHCSVHIQQGLPCCCCAMEWGAAVAAVPWGCWAAGCALPGSPPRAALGWAGLGLASLGLNCCFLWEALWMGCRGSVSSVLLSGCAWNNSLHEDVFFLHLSTMELSLYL